MHEVIDWQCMHESYLLQAGKLMIWSPVRHNIIQDTSSMSIAVALQATAANKARSYDMLLYAAMTALSLASQAAASQVSSMCHSDFVWLKHLQRYRSMLINIHSREQETDTFQRPSRPHRREPEYFCLAIHFRLPITSSIRIEPVVVLTRLVYPDVMEKRLGVLSQDHEPG